MQDEDEGLIAGPDGIETETLKICANVLTDPLTKIFNNILNNYAIPKQWYTSEIILLHKKGSKTDLNNYRPISLSANINKLSFKIVRNRIYPTLDAKQPLE